MTTKAITGSGSAEAITSYREDGCTNEGVDFLSWARRTGIWDEREVVVWTEAVDFHRTVKRAPFKTSSSGFCCFRTISNSTCLDW